MMIIKYQDNITATTIIKACLFSLVTLIKLGTIHKMVHLWEGGNRVSLTATCWGAGAGGIENVIKR